MRHKKATKPTSSAAHASLKKEMDQPRMARSARITQLKRDTAQVAEHPSTTMPGTVNKIIPPPRPSQPEKAQIAVDTAGRRYRNLRIENTLIDEHGDDVRLKKGAHVEVTVSEVPKTSTAALHDHRPPIRRKTSARYNS